METPPPPETSVDRRIADRLRSLRAERGWSLDELARQSGVSRSTLSRIENADVSATAAVLGRLCTAFGLPMSRLISMVEDEAPPLVRRNAQPVWTDAAVGFVRRQVSPPAAALAGEVIEGTLPPGAVIGYGDAPRPGLEHHLLLVDGGLEVEVGGRTYALGPGDCLRYRIDGPSAFRAAESGCRYFIFIV